MKEALIAYGFDQKQATIYIYLLQYRDKPAYIIAKETGIPFKGSEFGSDENQEGDEFLSVLSYSNNRMISTGVAFNHFGGPGTKHRFDNFVKSYFKWKETFGYYDFDDMLAAAEHTPVELGTRDVYLDEAQDCSPKAKPAWAATSVKVPLPLLRKS